MAKTHKELTEGKLEEYIENHLLNNEYIRGNPKDFDKDFALDIPKLFEFLENTQSEKLVKLNEKYGEKCRKKIIERISKEISNRSMIDVLRHGITDLGIELDLTYFKPNSTMNQDLNALYKKNIFVITRQLKYSKDNENSIDIVIFINGFPILAIELKNEFTGQNVGNGKYQFRQDRDPRESLFHYKKRLLAYFVVDTSEIYMTTRLAQNKTYFLPFNKGNNQGAGNPVSENGLKTAYFWEEILQKDSLMDIIKRFYFIQIEDEELENGDIKTKETAIFPRYHQLDVVRKIEKDILTVGIGKNFLIQHSAGSGKTNSISWLAHRMANLHNQKNENVFDTIIVITDRKVLDSQLQKAIYQLEHKHGVVVKIEKDSNQLAQAMQKGTKIIISTLQKFPFILDKIDELKKNKYAVIVDEAHSSTTGENMSSLKEVLAGKTLEESEKIQQESENNEIDVNEKIAQIVSKVANKKNISFFAFTATPKAKTLEMFGRKDSDGKPQAFHIYSMKQAIEEGFILDILKNYMTYKTYYNVNKKIEDNPEFDKGKASKAITRFVSLHPHNINQKVEIIVEDFIKNRQKWINGTAKAMIVTSSRKHAVRYKLAIDEYIKKNNYGIKTLIAFSGTVDDGVLYTESDMNKFKESELPKKFNTNEYNVLIVAEKYQTGFDQPLLCAMYVDKKLSDVKAVQTLSRLNRTTKGKNNTFILDFQNESEDIIKAFLPFYKTTEVDSEFDPNLVYDFQNKLNEFGVYLDQEIEDFNKIFFSEKIQYSGSKKIELTNNIIDLAVERYNKITDEEQEDFKSKAIRFSRLYNFVVLVASIEDIKLHKLYVYLTYLVKKLPRKKEGENIKLEDKVELTYFKLIKTLGSDKEGEDLLISEQNEEYKLMSPTFMGSSSQNEELKEVLEIIIKKLNEKFGTEFDKNTDLVIKQVKNDCNSNEELKKQAKANTIDDFALSFKNIFMDIVVDRMDSNQEFFMKVLSDNDFKNTMMDYMMPIIYENLRSLE